MCIVRRPSVTYGHHCCIICRSDVDSNALLFHYYSMDTLYIHVCIYNFIVWKKTYIIILLNYIIIRWLFSIQRVIEIKLSYLILKGDWNKIILSYLIKNILYILWWCFSDSESLSWSLAPSTLRGWLKCGITASWFNCFLQWHRVWSTTHSWTSGRCVPRVCRLTRCVHAGSVSAL